MAKRYAIWDKRSPVITPVGDVLTAEQWMARYPVSALPDITVVCAAGEMNGAFFGTLGQMRSAFENRGADFSRCETEADALLVMEAFEDAEDVYCVTITSGLSGSYNAATVASQTYLEMHPDKKVHVFDSLSAGPEMTLMTEKIRELVEQKLPFEKIVETVEAYKDKVRLVFSLESLHNLAQNGRVPVAVAKLAGLIGLRLIGKASDVGTLQPTGKARGEKKVVPELLKQLLSMGYQGGRVRIHHCCNLLAAENLKQALLEKFPAATVIVEQAGALCSFYAERGGLLVGFET